MQLKPGQRLRSQVCTTEVIIVRAPESDPEIGCGGQPMVEITQAVAEGATPAAGLDTGTEIGKRYTSAEESSLEVLVTKAGAGTLTADGEAMVFRATKPLPSSD